MNEFYSVLKPSETLVEIEKSKFIAHVFPVETERQAIDHINKVKKKHNNATHNVTAYYVRDDHFCKRYSDDGEPSGTAGMPSLQMILNKNIIDVCVVITRYFGGIKLGTGGLARAYADVTGRGLENSKIIPFQKMLGYELIMNYDRSDPVQYLLKKKNILVDNISYEEKVILKIFLQATELSVIDALIDLTSSNIEMINRGEIYISASEGQIIARKEV